MSSKKSGALPPPGAYTASRMSFGTASGGTKHSLTTRSAPCMGKFDFPNHPLQRGIRISIATGDLESIITYPSLIEGGNETFGPDRLLVRVPWGWTWIRLIKFFSLQIMVAQVVLIENPVDDIASPLGISTNMLIKADYPGLSVISSRRRATKSRSRTA